MIGQDPVTEFGFGSDEQFEELIGEMPVMAEPDAINWLCEVCECKFDAKHALEFYGNENEGWLFLQNEDGTWKGCDYEDPALKEQRLAEEQFKKAAEAQARRDALLKQKEEREAWNAKRDAEALSGSMGEKIVAFNGDFEKHFGRKLNGVERLCRLPYSENIWSGLNKWFPDMGVEELCREIERDTQIQYAEGKFWNGTVGRNKLAQERKGLIVELMLNHGLIIHSSFRGDHGASLTIEQAKQIVADISEEEKAA
jgi:hypothetical protein